MPGQSKIPLMRYQYDALDRLASEGRLAHDVRWRFYCENRLVTEFDEAEQLSIIKHGDQLLGQHHHRGDGPDNVLLATDQQHSVLNTLQMSRQDAFAYSAYGHCTFENGSRHPLGFNGQRRDPVTGHYLLGNGYRAFNPVLMRFNSPDYLSPFDKGGLNAYVYCAGDPVNRSDPTGHFFSVLKTAFSNIKARYLSFVSGDHVKPVNQYTRISEKLVVFVDTYKGGSRLNIFGHGTASGGVLKESKIFLGPKSLSEYVENAGFRFESFESTRLLTCHSGSEFNHLLNPTNAPFGQMFSDFSGLPAKAYKGRFLGGARVTPSISRLKVGETSTRTEYFSITKRPESRRSKFLEAPYNPVSFQPSNLIHKVRTD